MDRRIAAAALLIFCLEGHGASRVITVEDMVRFATIGDPQDLSYYDRSDEAVGLFSPGGVHVAVVVHGGNPQSGTNDATLLLYETAALLTDPRPETLVRFASATNSRPMAMVRWLPDNETLILAGTDGERLPQVYRVNIRTKKLEQLTQEAGLLAVYELSPSAQRLVTLAQPPAGEGDPECRRGGCRITAENLWTALQGVTEVTSAFISVQDLRTRQTRTLADRMAADDNLTECQNWLEGDLSPDGRFALRQCSLRQWPSWWTEYTADPELRGALLMKNPVYAQQLMVIDLDAGSVRALNEAPSLQRNVRAVDPIWIDGGRSFILAGALEPLSGVDAPERARRTASRAVLLADPVTLKATRIVRLDPGATIAAASWDQKTQTLLLERKDANDGVLPPVAYRRGNKRWTEVAARAPMAQQKSVNINLIVEQSLNDRPVLVAVDAATGARKQLLDPNPWLAQRQVGRVEKINWDTSKGGRWRGGLYYPPDYHPGKRYPLLLQTHGFEEDRFMLPGESTLFPGQALAAHGVMVLQVAENMRNPLSVDAVSTPLEWPLVQAGYEGAIDHLDALGLIDRAKVGIVGWSRTGPHAGYTITHSDYPFAAAAFTATADFGWYYFMLAGATDDHYTYYGGSPFGPGMAGWLEDSATFNLQRVRTPAFLWGGSGGRVSLWDWNAGLRGQNKPVEFWTSENGIHEVFKVQERLRLNGLLIDWFRFWLKDEEDAAPAKAAQYVRWRKLRVQQEEVLKQPRPPLLDWSAVPKS